jgi:hypothetical protein
MRKQHHPSAVLGSSSSPALAKGGALSRCVEFWISDGQAAGWSARTIAARRDMFAKFARWLGTE